MRLLQSCSRLLKPNEPFVYFAWHLTNWCNYKCSYCPTLRQITNDFTVDDHAKMYKSVLARLNTVETPFTMCLTGGEPTLYPHLYDVVKGLSENKNCVNAVLMTNLSRPVSYYQQFADIGSEKIVVMASAHPEYTKRDQFIQKAIAMSKHTPMRFTAHICLMDDPATWQTTKQYIDILRGEGVNVKPNLLYETLDSKQRYTKEFYDIFEPYLQDNDGGLLHELECRFDDGTVEALKDYEVELRGLNCFKGFRCKTAAFKITMEGEIRNVCTNRHIPILLNDKNLLVEEICPKDVCAGRQLLTYPKRR